jgi:RNase P subunit RPR2
MIKHKKYLGENMETRQCDNCIKTFKINKTLTERLRKDKVVTIYCPYCENTFNHVYIKKRL